MKHTLLRISTALCLSATASVGAFAQTSAPAASETPKTSETPATAPTPCKKQCRVMCINKAKDGKAQEFNLQNLDKSVLEELKKNGIELNVTTGETVTVKDGSAPNTERKVRVIRVNRDGATTQEFNSVNEVNIDKDVQAVVKEIEQEGVTSTNGAKPRVMVIEKNITNDGKEVQVDVNVNADDKDGAVKTTSNHVVVLKMNKDGHKKDCTVKVESSAEAKGQAYSIEVNGLDEEVMKEVEKGLKGIDENTAKMVQEKLKNLNIRVDMPNQGMEMNLDGEETQAGAHAKVRVFISKDAKEGSWSEKPVEVNVNATATEEDGKTIVKKVYVIRMKKDENNSENAKVTTEQLSEQGALATNGFSLFPNPSEDGRFTLKFNLPAEGNTLIRVTDINGREVYQETLNNFSGAYEKPFDLSGYGKGAYLVNVTQNGKTATMKVAIE